MVLPIHSSAAKQVLWVCASIKGLKENWMKGAD